MLRHENALQQWRGKIPFVEIKMVKAMNIIELLYNFLTNQSALTFESKTQ